MIGFNRKSQCIAVIFGQGTVSIGLATSKDRKAASIVLRELARPHEIGTKPKDASFTGTYPVELYFDSIAAVKALEHKLRQLKDVLEESAS